jgi:hypothetical protein
MKCFYFRFKEVVVIAERQITVQMNLHKGKSMIQIQKVTKDFNVNVELLKSKDTPQKTVGLETRIKAKDCLIG